MQVDCPQCDGSVEVRVDSDNDWAGRLIPLVGIVDAAECECSQTEDWEKMIINRAIEILENDDGE